MIALSVVFVAAEVVHGLRGKPGLTARAPWVVAFSFGLLHGFGFAGALAEVGLPQESHHHHVEGISVGEAGSFSHREKVAPKGPDEGLRGLEDSRERRSPSPVASGDTPPPERRRGWL